MTNEDGIKEFLPYLMSIHTKTDDGIKEFLPYLTVKLYVTGNVKFHPSR